MTDLSNYLYHLGIDIFRLILWLVLLSALFLPVERFFSLRQCKVSFATHIHNIFYFFFNGILPLLVISVPLASIAVIVQKLTPAAYTNFIYDLPIAIKLILAFFIGEIGFYWGHRFSHEVPFLWKFHSIHHSSEDLYFLVNTRAHPVDIMVTRVFGLLPLYMLGLAGTNLQGSVTPSVIIIIATVWGFFIHSNTKFRLGIFENLITSPAFHHWHHSKIDHINHNYASMLPILDHVFGTYYLPRQWPSDYGLDVPPPKKLSEQIIFPFRHH